MKNYTLNNINNINSKNGFAMIMAIVVLIIISGIMAISLTLSSQTAKRTSDLYLYEQANIYTKSETEYTLLKIATNPPCVEPSSINYTIDNIYDINISLRYVYSETSTCFNAIVPQGTPYFSVTTPEQNGSVLIDTTVTTNIGTEPIRIFKRTIQKL